MVTISLPCGVVVSAQGSLSDLKLASQTRRRIDRRLSVERVSRSGRLTTTTSPGRRLDELAELGAISLRSGDQLTFAIWR